MNGGERLAHVLHDDWLGDVRSHPMERLRAMRAECQSLETGVPYLRRLVQGRVDIVAAVRRGHDEGEEVGVGDLVNQLGAILADRARPPGLGRLPQHLVPAGDTDTAELDALLPAGRIGDLPGMSDAELATTEAALRDLEHRVSARRRALHQRIDALQGEMTRRYREGEATVESLLP